MMSMNIATVYEQVPSKHGVKVVWQNHRFQSNSDAGVAGSPGENYGFVRVGVSRAHPSLASVTDLPAIGEMGLVANVDEEISVWVCSLHWLDDNAIVPNMKVNRSDSGITFQENPEGECQIDFPSGAKLRSTHHNTAMVIPPGPRIKDLGAGEGTYMALDHPSGLTINISPLGDVVIDRANTIAMTAVQPISITGFGTFNLQTLPIGDNPNAAADWAADYVQPVIDITLNSGAKLNLTSTGDTVVNAGGNLNLNATGTVNLQGGGARFVMESFVTWAKTHTHTSASSGSPTTAPLGTDPTTTATHFSKSTLKGATG